MSPSPTSNTPVLLLTDQRHDKWIEMKCVRNEYRRDVWIKPRKALEYITLQCVVTPNGATFQI